MRAFGTHSFAVRTLAHCKDYACVTHLSHRTCSSVYSTHTTHTAATHSHETITIQNAIFLGANTHMYTLTCSVRCWHSREYRFESALRLIGFCSEPMEWTRATDGYSPLCRAPTSAMSSQRYSIECAHVVFVYTGMIVNTIMYI